MKLFGRVARRLALTLLTLFLVSVLVFGLVELMPGNVGVTILGPYATEEQVALINHELGVDRPLLTRYAEWIGRFGTGDWGTSYLSRQDVLPLVLDRFLNSLLLAILILVIVVPIALGTGILAALRRHRATDRVVSQTGIAFLAIPEFVSGVVLLVLLAVRFPIFPTTGHSASDTSALSTLHHLALPAMVGALGLYAYLMRMTRAGMIRELGSDYARTATMKGLPRRRVVFRHVVPNALLPTITVIGAQFGAIVGSLVIIESLFDYPGIGDLILISATGHDVLVLEAAVLVVALVYLGANLLADLTYGLLDPRVRRGRD